MTGRGDMKPTPSFAVGLFFLLRPWVADLDRALIRKPAVVVLVVHDLAPLPEPSGQPVWLSLTLRAMVALAYMVVELVKQLTDWA